MAVKGENRKSGIRAEERRYPQLDGTVLVAEMAYDWDAVTQITRRWNRAHRTKSRGYFHDIVESTPKGIIFNYDAIPAALLSNDMRVEEEGVITITGKIERPGIRILDPEPMEPNDPAEIEALVREAEARAAEVERARSGHHRKLARSMAAFFALTQRLKDDPVSFGSLLRGKGMKVPKNLDREKLAEVAPLKIVQLFLPNEAKQRWTDYATALRQAEIEGYSADDFEERILTKEEINGKTQSGVDKLLEKAKASKPKKDRTDAVGVLEALECFADGLPNMGTITDPRLEGRNEFVLLLAWRVEGGTYEVIEVIEDNPLKVWKAVS